ncbi:MAG: hypothetical protein ACFCBW_15465 [Candidatus Competibacterales bacterium]
MAKVLTVVRVGFTDYDERLLKSILILASDDQFIYQCTKPSPEGCNLFIVNADSERAVMHWRAYSLNCAHTPTVMVSRKPIEDGRHSWVKWPLEAKALLATLRRLRPFYESLLTPPPQPPLWNSFQTALQRVGRLGRRPQPLAG